MSRKKQPCQVDGVEYGSEKMAAKSLGIGADALRHRLRSPNYPGYISKHRPKIDARPAKYPCRIDGVEYESAKMAAKSLGIDAGSLRHRLRSPNYPEYTSKCHPKVNIKPLEQPCRVDGIDYESGVAAARALGISSGALRNRLRSPNYPEYISEHRPKIDARPAKYPCRVDGIDYESEKMATKVLGIDAGLLRYRLLSSGYPNYISQYHTKVDSNIGGRQCTVNGVEHESEIAAAKTLGITLNLLQNRLRSPNYPGYISKHRPKVEAKPQERPCTINGVEYESQKAAARVLGISESALRYRFLSPNYPEYASEYHPRVDARPIKYPCRVDGIDYESGVAAARALGIGVSVLRNRLRSLSYPEYTSEYHPKVDLKPRGKPCVISGVEYESGFVAARTLGISPGSLWLRLRSPNYPEYTSEYYPKVPRKPRKRRPCTIKGVVHESLGVATKALGIPEALLRYRLLSYYYPDYTSKYHSKEDFGEIVRIRVGDIEYDSIEYAAKKLELSLESLRARLASFDYPDHVCADIPKKIEYKVCGKVYKTIREIAESEGETIGRIHQKINDPAYPDYTRSDIPNEQLTPKYTVRGKMYSTLKQIAEAEGATVREIQQKMGSTLEPDYVCPRIPKKPPSLPKYRAHGKTYRTIREIAESEGETIGRIHQKINDPAYPDYTRSDIPNKQLTPKYTVRGKPYSTLKQIAEAEGATVREIRQKMGNTLEPDYVCPRIPKKPPSLPKYRAHGKIYRTIREIAEIEGLPVEEISDRFSDELNSEYKRLWKRHW